MSNATTQLTMEALRAAKKLCDQINEFGQCLDVETFNSAYEKIEAALTAQTMAEDLHSANSASSAEIHE